MTDKKVTPLRAVAPPTADEEARQEVIDMLEEALEEAKRGEITEIVMILKRPNDDEWDERATVTRFMSAWIGKLEMLKHDWILQLKLYERTHE